MSRQRTAQKKYCVPSSSYVAAGFSGETFIPQTGSKKVSELSTIISVSKETTLSTP
jgi:hypothetical protein